VQKAKEDSASSEESGGTAPAPGTPDKLDVKEPALVNGTVEPSEEAIKAGIKQALERTLGVIYMSTVSSPPPL
jgi:hypothetical protein